MSTRQDFGSNFQLVRDTVYYKTVTRLYSACAGKFGEYTHTVLKHLRSNVNYDCIWCENKNCSNCESLNPINLLKDTCKLF